MKKLNFLGLTLLTSMLGAAQVSNYVFENSVAPFPYIAASGAAIQEHIILDDYVMPSTVDLPFDFDFGGTPQDSLSISENGFIWFGSAPQSDVTVTTPISQDQLDNVTGIISALGIDLHPQTTGSLPTRLRSATIGTAPYRIFVIEWFHTSRIETINDLNGPDEMDFQIRLSETTNKVEIVFGRFFLNQDYTNYVEVGLKTTGNDFSNRSTFGTNWYFTEPGLNRDSTCELNYMFRPAVGHSFVWHTSSLGVDEENLDQISIYPVPSTSTIQVSGLGNNPAKYVIYDIIGRPVKRGETFGENIDVQSLSSGGYILRLDRSGEFTSRKFIKN